MLQYQSICSKYGSYEVGKYLDNRVNKINQLDAQTIYKLQKYMDNEKLKTIADYHDIISYQQGGKKSNNYAHKIIKGVSDVQEGVKKVKKMIKKGEQLVEEIDKNPITRELKKIALSNPKLKKAHDVAGKNIKKINKQIEVVEKTIDMIPNTQKPK